MGQEHKAHEAKLSVRQREVNAMEEKVEAHRDPVAFEELIAGFERRCAELEAQRIRHQQESTDRKLDVQNEILKSCYMMQEHEKMAHDKILESKRYWDQKKQSLRKISKPANITRNEEAEG
mmetsp:Transcript_16646/g.21754  ORF Transcript_16646/g.21754 Transcript_16646/m.21754 type:complete len:121 (+) Transcript_16646:199-561(+)